MPRRTFFSRHAAQLVLLAASALICASAVAATKPSRQAQRNAFKQAYAAAQAGNPDWRAMAANLKNYPLYPWLPATAMEQDLAHVQTARVERYLKRYHGLVPAHDLRRRFLAELAQRKDWTDFRKLYRPGLGTSRDCEALQGRLAQGEALTWKELAPIWRHASLPSACTPIQKWAHEHGLLTHARLWQRIDRAVRAGNGGTVAWLARWLSGTDQNQAQHLAQALRHPAKAARDAVHWPDNTRNRHAATLAMVQLARADSDAADKAWPPLHKHFRFTTTQVNDIRAAMALFVATDFSDDAVQRLADLPAAAQTNTTRAWRVRVALAKRNWPAALKALDALTPAQQRQGEWTYWRARVLDKLGHTNEAHALYAKEAKRATYYGFLAADRIHQPYAICSWQLDPSAGATNALLAQPRMQRAFELYAVGLYLDARRVWNRALRGASTETRHLAAMVAWHRGWYNRAIRTFSHGKLMHLYTQRYPVPRADHVDAQAQDAGIAPSWAYAIIRAESAWAPGARSSADARGLMQLLPATAQLVSRRQDITFDDDLFNPQTNVALGTHYLAHLAAHYGGSPWLASAAYNAGPNVVDEWLTQRGALPPDIFVAAIPYHETRTYVMRVMAYAVIYDWRLHGNAVALTRRMPRFGRAYVPPTASTPRKSVICPTTVTASR